MNNKPLQVCTFEINLDLSTIPANRQWTIPLFTSGSPPNMFFQIPLGKNVLVKKIEATCDMGTVSPNNTIVVEDYQMVFRLMEFNNTILGISRGLIVNPSSGAWSITSNTFDTIALTMNNPTLDFDEGIIMGGLELFGGGQIILSNTTTPLPAIARFYVNIYFQDILENETTV